MNAKFISLFLSLLFVSSPLSYGLNLHYCADRLVTVESIFESHHGCGMETEAIFTAQTQFNSNCCADVFLGTTKFADYTTKSELVMQAEVSIHTTSFYWDPSFVTYEQKPALATARPPDLVEKLFLVHQQWTLYG